MVTGENKQRRNIRYLAVTAGLLAALCFLILICLSVGSTKIPLQEVLAVLSGKEAEDSALVSILFQIRLPRVIAAAVLGGALSVSGFLLQTFFSNPIAGPFVLGISSGAKLVVALTMVYLLGQGMVISSLGMILAAFIGSLICMAFVITLSPHVKNMSLLVVCGVMVGYICSAVTDFVVTFADDSNIVNLHNWSLGSFSGISWEHVRILIPVTALMVAAAFLLSKPIGAYQMGEAYARNMGVNIRLLRIQLILISSLLSACVTAFAGPISFVGIAVPHLIRGLSGTARPLYLTPWCFLGGAVVTLFCDAIARTVFAPTEISISSVTAVFLVPVVIYLMVKRQR